MSELRPKFNSEIAKIAATEVADALIRNGQLESSARSDAIESLAKHGNAHRDGYELAKRLDDYEHWDCDFEMAEVLDGFACCVDSAIRTAEKDWAERTLPQPPLPVRTRIAMSRGEFGIIDGIYDYGVASYTVKVEGDPAADGPSQSRRIIRFEDATAAVEAAK